MHQKNWIISNKDVARFFSWPVSVHRWLSVCCHIDDNSDHGVWSIEFHSKFLVLSVQRDTKWCAKLSGYQSTISEQVNQTVWSQDVDYAIDSIEVRKQTPRSWLIYSSRSGQLQQVRWLDQPGQAGFVAAPVAPLWVLSRYKPGLFINIFWNINFAILRLTTGWVHWSTVP